MRTEDGTNSVTGQIARVHESLCSIPESNKTKQNQQNCLQKTDLWKVLMRKSLVTLLTLGINIDK